MAEITPLEPELERDGTSQSERTLPALAPESVGVDERKLEDWLAFAHAYSKGLKYFDTNDEADGDWSAFLNPDGLDDDALSAQWREMGNFLADPAGFDDSSVHRRPHLVLFLAFLHLMGLSQQRLNQLPRQHLDFYYRQFLALQTQAGHPDRVHILVSLSADATQALLPAGTWLEAGKDSLGQELFYCTDEDLVANRAQIKNLYSVFVDKKTTGSGEAQTEEWLNLYATADATSVKAANVVGTPRWRTFGQRQVLSEDQPPPPSLGWAIASPALCLAEGLRKVILTLVFQADSYSDIINTLLVDPYPFLIEASGEKGWLAPTKFEIESGDYPAEAANGNSAETSGTALRFTLEFDQSVPPIVTMPGATSDWPMLRLMLRPCTDGTPYLVFQRLALERVLMAVSVAGLKDVGLENDEGSLSTGKPFEPFGASPGVGSGFQFAHPELVTKRLDRLAVNLQWMKLPGDDLGAHYANYPGDLENSSFTVSVSLVDHGVDMLLANPALLFEKDKAAEPHKIEISGIPSLVPQGYVYLPEPAPFDLDTMSSWPRYWRWELNAPDFQHAAYAQVANTKAMEYSSAIAAGFNSDPIKAPDPTAYQVNPPYTPKLKSFSVDYECSMEIVMNPEQAEAGQAYGSGAERIFHQHPFSVAEIQPDPDTGLFPFLPEYSHAGELYIGLEGVATSPDTPQDLALLFQMAEGSANPDLPAQPVTWSYLSGNCWIDLGDSGGVLADSTAGLIQAGIVKFRLPHATPDTLLPATLYWLRAAVAQQCDSLCDTVAIHAQALAATWVDKGNAPDHLDQALPAETIARTANAIPGVLAVSQPYTSWGGKPGEEDAMFNTRVSERLRHKQRAQTQWDFEHLILERFPGIYTAKCIPTTSNAPDDLGRVNIIVIPDIRNQLPFNPFEPKATAGQIAEINRFLEGLVSPLAEVKARNAFYVPIRVRFAVRFMPGCEPGYYKTCLNDELNRFLSPWAYGDGAEVTIGSTIYANAIIDFLERRSYVDYVAELTLFKNEDGKGFVQIADTDNSGYRVYTDRPDGVLVTDGQHFIDLIDADDYDETQFTGIGYMAIEWDFRVSQN